ncbi:hypothetical protein WJX73_006727 [Symbiochloris irregularis]|uniref:Chorismate lyase n=1 Tax=Symbiochloris irregularis TaxID=706552 RepID=A0AAW1NM82_9CHLO
MDSVHASTWYPLNVPLLWQGTEEEALKAGTPVAELPAPWKVILLSDGSVTRHLQMMMGMKVEVECFEMRNIGEGDKETEKLPEATRHIERPLLQRQVLLRQPNESTGEYATGTPLVYAASWWNADMADNYLQDKEAPIWVSLMRDRTELYREIQVVSLGNSSFLQRTFSRPGPFWGRQYLFWHGGKPLTLIHEVFSSSLEAYLGPCPMPRMNLS